MSIYYMIQAALLTTFAAATLPGGCGVSSQQWDF